MRRSARATGLTPCDWAKGTTSRHSPSGIASRCRRRFRQAARAGCTRAKPTAKARSDNAVLFAAIIWQQDYPGGHNRARIVAEATLFICYSSPKGHEILDSQLYLPQCWFKPAHEERRRLCDIPQDTTFQTKPEIALGLLQPLLASQLFGGHWITFDCSFGNNEAFLEGLPKDFYYLGEIACTRKVWPKACAGQPQLEQEGCTVEHLLEVKGLLNWQTHRIAEGEKGPLWRRPSRASGSM